MTISTTGFLLAGAGLALGIPFREARPAIKYSAAGAALGLMGAYLSCGFPLELWPPVVAGDKCTLFRGLFSSKSKEQLAEENAECARLWNLSLLRRAALLGVGGAVLGYGVSKLGRQGATGHGT